MAENSGIQWTTHTFNPWRGCTKVSAGCANCYAETLSGRNSKTLGVWGPMGTRVVAAEAQWKLPLKWNRAAQIAEDVWHERNRNNPNGNHSPYQRPRVFCASLADVFENWQGKMDDSKGQQLWVAGNGWTANPGGRTLALPDVRRRLFELIDATPNLDWLLLTKRPENIAGMMPPYRWHDKRERRFHEGRSSWPEVELMNSPAFKPDVWLRWPRPNVWIGTSVENQQAADERIPHLLSVPAAVRFLSVEPLLGPVALRDCRYKSVRDPALSFAALGGTLLGGQKVGGIDWVIVGGESGPGARPCSVDWIRLIVQQCKAAGVPVFVKQLGSNPTWTHYTGKPTVGIDQPYCASSRQRRDGIQTLTRLGDKNGGDMAEWPEDLRVREFPKAVPHA